MKQETRTYENEKTVRVVTKDDGTAMYCLVDIARCVGRRELRSYATRNSVGEKMHICWSNGVQHGMVWTVCVSIEEIVTMADRVDLPKKFVEWLRANHSQSQSPEIISSGSQVIVENDDMESNIAMMLDMLNNLTYACLDLKRELEKSRKRVVSFT